MRISSRYAKFVTSIVSGDDCVELGEIKMMLKDDLVIGLFYQDERGKVLRISGWNGQEMTVAYNYDDNFGRREIPLSEALASWTKRHDLEDFPDARDPRIPSSFDLFWDIKTRSELVNLLISKEEEDDVRAMMKKHGVVLTDDELQTVSDGNYIAPVKMGR